MHPAHTFGYEHRSNGTVVITRGCRIISVVRGEGQVGVLLAELAQAAAGGGRQQVLARWVTETAKAA
ncbi:hypothetical protein ACIGEZ_08310 [Streptomyces sp. NPDC085481]|uniref:hypothetical protein n=1 Tax=Streptomyces sp. NPDC085481 TaxID=3365727 RepID=UPI0037D71ADA